MFSLFSIISDLPGTFIFSKASFIMSLDIPIFLQIPIAANALYTVNLPGISTLILSFLSVIFTLKSTYEFVIVISFAKKFPVLSMPYAVMSLSGNIAGILFPCISSIFTNPVLHILNNFNFDSK